MPRVPVTSRQRLFIACLFALAAGPTVAHAQLSTLAAASVTAFSADAVKAAYLVNFIRFTEWPASSGSSDTLFVIGVVGNRDLEEHLIKLTDGKLLQGRRVRVSRLTTVSDAINCQVLYIHPPSLRADAVSITTEEWLQAVRDRPVLSVTHESGILVKGGIINFYAEGNNLRFEIAPQNAAAAGLELSSRLLAIARIVRPEASLPTTIPTPASL